MSTSPQCSQCKSALLCETQKSLHHKMSLGLAVSTMACPCPADVPCRGTVVSTGQTDLYPLCSHLHLTAVSCQHLAQVVVCSLKADHLPCAHFHMIIQNCVLHSLFHFLREDMDTKEVNFIVWSKTSWFKEGILQLEMDQEVTYLSYGFFPFFEGLLKRWMKKYFPFFFQLPWTRKKPFILETASSFPGILEDKMHKCRLPNKSVRRPSLSSASADSAFCLWLFPSQEPGFAVGMASPLSSWAAPTAISTIPLFCFATALLSWLQVYVDQFQSPSSKLICSKARKTLRGKQVGKEQSDLPCPQLSHFCGAFQKVLRERNPKQGQRNWNECLALSFFFH